jgi:hypothetical protein
MCHGAADDADEEKEEGWRQVIPEQTRMRKRYRVSQEENIIGRSGSAAAG